MTSGSYDQTFDLALSTSSNPAFVTAQGTLGGALDALRLGLAGGDT